MIPSCLQCSDSIGNAQKGLWATVCPGDSQDGERSRHLIMNRREDRAVGASLLEKLDRYTRVITLCLCGFRGERVRVCEFAGPFLLFVSASFFSWCFDFVCTFDFWLSVHTAWKFICRSSLRPGVEALFFQRGLSFALTRIWAHPSSGPLYT